MKVFLVPSTGESSTRSGPCAAGAGPSLQSILTQVRQRVTFLDSKVSSPGSIIFDSTLTQLTFNKHEVSASMSNTGQTVRLRVSNSEVPVYLRGGPLVYTYTFTEVIFHWADRGSQDGSEHSINHHSFPAEVQIYGYNSDLYPNMSVAREEVRGLVAVSLMVQQEEAGARLKQDHSRSHSGLGAIIARLPNIKYSGQETTIPRISLAHIVPNTGEFITYEGSTTYPGCWETVTWIMMNKPVYISRQEMELFQQLSQGSDRSEGEQPGLGNTLRPRQNLNRRIVRTNIDLKYQGDCSVDTSSERQFQANTWLHRVAQDRLTSARGEFILK